MAWGWLASPPISLPIPLVVGHHGGYAIEESWGNTGRGCIAPVTVALPQCPKKVQAQVMGADRSQCC